MREKNSRPDKILGSSRKPPSAASNSNKPSSSKGSKKGGASSKHTNPPTHTQKQRSEEDTKDSAAERARQQVFLDVFSSTFATVLGARDFNAQLQELKAALFARDFEGAFAREAALDVYAARWSPTRALCYGRILRGLAGHLKGRTSSSPASSRQYSRRSSNRRSSGIQLKEMRSREDISKIRERMRDVKLEEQNEAATTGTNSKSESSTEARKPGEDSGTDADADKDDDEQKREAEGENKQQTLRVLAIGGAAAEVVAFADFVSDSGMVADITLLDVGPWGSVVGRLHASLLESAPVAHGRELSTTYEKGTSSLVTATDFRVEFTQRDILSMKQGELEKLLRTRPTSTTTATDNPVLITLLFTLNELYAAGGIKLTTIFLRALTGALAPGTLLLVVDSPGSYSEAAVGKEARKYPMQWLLDHTLLSTSSPASGPRQRTGVDTAGSSDGTKTNANTDTGGDRDADEGQEEVVEAYTWQKIESSDSTWFRLPDGLRYPIQLENMRYQLHLYRYCACD